MKKMFVFVVAIMMLSSFNHSSKPVGAGVEKGIPLFYTGWSDWGMGITFDAAQIQWNTDTRNWIKAVPGTYVSTHSQEQQSCAECITEYRYQMCYFKTAVEAK
jgi:hypothetical protein